MLWQVAARVYADKRREFATMDAATFAAYHEKWREKGRVGLLNAEESRDSHMAAKWEGFNDALWDEKEAREGHTGAPRDSWWEGLLDYLYDKE